MAAVNRAAQYLAAIIGTLGTQPLVLWILETGVLATEGQQHVASSTLTMLGNDNLCHAVQVASIVVLIDVLILRTVYEQHHIGILLDGSRLTQVAQLRSLTLQALTTLDTTVQL